MPVVGDFLGQYRILALLFRTPSSELYYAEHTVESAGPALMIFYPAVEFTTAEDQNVFLQKARISAIAQGEQNIAFRDAGVANQHPYLVTAYTEATRSTATAIPSLMTIHWAI